jgi:probable rRNA maturation factor
MLVDTIVEDERWNALGLEGLAAAAAVTTLQHLDLDPDAFEIALLATDDTRIAVLNADFRGKPQSTNVLSWPSEERGADTDGGQPELPDPDPDPELGDIAIAYDTCLREADEAGKSLSDHVTHLLVHGTLHLLGYDHERDRDATLMEGLERKILGSMGLPDPYWEDDRA